MNIYTYINIWILFFALVAELVHGKSPKNRKNDKSNSLIFKIPIFMILLFVTGFRGDFSPDYSTYISIFYIDSSKSFFGLFRGGTTDIGFSLLNKVLSFFSLNPVFYMTCIAILLLGCYFYFYDANSSIYWLSILLLVSLGSYYTFFNTMRQFLAGILCAIAAKYIYQRNFPKYFLSIILISFIHLSSLIMLPFYWLLTIKWKNKKAIMLLPLFVSIYFLVFLYLKPVVHFFANLFYKGYLSSTAFGMSTGIPMSAVTRFFGLFLFSLIMHKFIDFNNLKERVWFNAGIYALLFSILSVQIEMIQRFTYFFLPFMTVLIPLVITRVPNKKIKLLLLLFIITISLGYTYATHTGDVYYFYK